MLEQVFKLLNFLQKSDGIDLSGAEQRWMGELGFLALRTWNQLSQIFLEESTQLDHNNKELFAGWTIFDDETL